MHQVGDQITQALLTTHESHRPAAPEEPAERGHSRHLQS
jgi:hypothetical protein